MEMFGFSGPQAPWIHFVPYMAPKPISDASVWSRRSEESILREWGIIVFAVQWGRKSSHQRISALASLLSVMWWCIRFTVVLRSINRLENIRPGRTTLHMCPSLPMRDFNCRFVHVRLFLHLRRISMESMYFSSGTQSTKQLMQFGAEVVLEKLTIPWVTGWVSFYQYVVCCRGNIIQLLSTNDQKWKTYNWKTGPACTSGPSPGPLHPAAPILWLVIPLV